MQHRSTRQAPHISSLSQVLPPGSVYFYAFPAGWDSRYFNDCPPELEELVAMRPVVCAGEQVGVVTFASTARLEAWSFLERLQIPLMPRERLLILPAGLDHRVHGARRNQWVKEALADLVGNGQLIMAQPYLDEALCSRYRLDPELVVYLNDKQNIRDFVPAAFCIPEYARFPTGVHLRAADSSAFPLPCVVKVASSGAGDGVRICRSAGELERAQQEFQISRDTVMVQKYIDRVGDVDLKFAIPWEEAEPVQLIGFSSEVTGPGGTYLGSVVHPADEMPEVLQAAFDVLETCVLPQLRARGWFGVGGVDVLVSRDGSFYFSDFNCRMTASMAQTLQLNSGSLGRRSALTFNGRFAGTLSELEAGISPIAQFGDARQSLNVIAVASDEGGSPVRLHGSVLFDQPEMLGEQMQRLTQLGIQASVFEAAGLESACRIPCP